MSRLLNKQEKNIFILKAFLKSYVSPVIYHSNFIVIKRKNSTRLIIIFEPEVCSAKKTLIEIIMKQVS